MNKIVFRPVLPPFITVVLMLLALAAVFLLVSDGMRSLRERILTMARFGLILLLVFFISLRPMRESHDVMVTMKNMDILFVLDTTISMYAEDATDKGGARMVRAVKDCEHIIDELGGGNMGLIRFDNISQVLSPFTQDATNVRDAFSTIDYLDPSYANGSNLNVPYKDMEELLISSSKKEGRKTYVFFLSDGEITDGSQLSSYKDLAQYVDGGAVLGYGSDKGGWMRVDTGYRMEYITDPETGDYAVSRIDEGNLQQIAGDLGISYIAPGDETQLEGILSRIILEASDIAGKNKSAVSYDDLYQYLTPFLLLGLVWELVHFLRRGKNL